MKISTLLIGHNDVTRPPGYGLHMSVNVAMFPCELNTWRSAPTAAMGGKTHNVADLEAAVCADLPRPQPQPQPQPQPPPQPHSQPPPQDSQDAFRRLVRESPPGGAPVVQRRGAGVSAINDSSGRQSGPAFNNPVPGRLNLNLVRGCWQEKNEMYVLSPAQNVTYITASRLNTDRKLRVLIIAR